MIDENKIEEAAEEQLENLGAYGLDEVDLGKEHQVTLYREDDVKAMFKAGINWFKENLWHNASEEPKEGKRLLVECTFTGKKSYAEDTKKSLYNSWQTKVNKERITRWLYIEDLTKGGK